jgi:hypothetical protein
MKSINGVTVRFPVESRQAQAQYFEVYDPRFSVIALVSQPLMEQ